MAQPQPQMHYFVSRRDQAVRSTLGHVITFEANQPTHVPKALHALVLEKGILPCDKDGKDLDLAAAGAAVPQEVKVLVTPETAEEREDALVALFKQMIKRNNPSEFTGGGRPSAAACSLALGWKVDQKEVGTVWVKHRPDLLGAQA